MTSSSTSLRRIPRRPSELHKVSTIAQSSFAIIPKAATDTFDRRRTFVSCCTVTTGLPTASPTNAMYVFLGSTTVHWISHANSIELAHNKWLVWMALRASAQPYRWTAELRLSVSYTRRSFT